MADVKLCPECGESVTGKVCDCGWSPGAIAKTGPRKVDEVLTEILSQWASNGGRWPVDMPPAPRDAACWWMDMQETGGDHEKPTQGKRGWKTPYQDRLSYTLRIYLRSPQKLQHLVFVAREDNIWWRGDSFEFFTKVIEETERMREIGIEQYREESMSAMKAMAHRIDQHNVAA